MTALAAVARGDDGLAARAPLAEHALDRLRREIGPVGEDDDGGVGLGRQRGKAAAKRRARALGPPGAADDTRVGLDLVGAENDDDVVDRGAADAVEHLGQEEPLLRRAEARRGARGEDDSEDQVQPRSERQAAVTFAT